MMTKPKTKKGTKSLSDSLPSVLELKLHGQKIGELHHLGGGRTIFSLSPDYIKLQRRNRPTLGLSFHDQLGELIADDTVYQTFVMPYLSNLLPEGILREYIAKEAGIYPDREFELLCLLGRDLPGAVTLSPKHGDTILPTTSTSAGPADAADAAVTAATTTAASSAAAADATSSNEPLLFSLAGVQLKFSAVEDGQGGFVIPEHGLGGTWIVKPPHPTFEHVPENELSMMELARMLGMDVPRTKLVPVERIANIPIGLQPQHGNAYVVERFDRNDKQRMHMEDFAQVFGVYPKDKYSKGSMSSIASVVASRCPQQDTVELVRRIVFNVLIGNGDMHLKNWSLIYKDKVHPSLAPAYDFLSTVPYTHDTTSALKICRTNEFAQFNYAELTNLAIKAMIPENLVIDTAKETVERFHELWAQEKQHLPISKTLVDAIDKHIRTIPLR